MNELREQVHTEVREAYLSIDCCGGAICERDQRCECAATAADEIIRIVLDHVVREARRALAKDGASDQEVGL